MKKQVFFKIALVSAIALMAAGCSSSTTTTNTTSTTPTPTAVASTTTQDEAGVKSFTVTGSNYSFAPNEIKVNKGDKVKITFQNSDGFHDFVIDQFNVKTKTIPAGQSDSVEFTADQAGTFQFYCSVGNHRQMGMVGNLIVQ